jgi:hypothetical protein
MTAPVFRPDETESENDDLYDVVPDDPPVRVAPPVAVAPKTVAYARRSLVSSNSAVERLFPDRVKDLYLPLWLIAGGTVIDIAIFAMYGIGSPRGLFAVLGWNLIVSPVLMLLTAIVVGKIRAINFGPVATALLKLSAIGVAPMALNLLLCVMLQWLWLLGAILAWTVSFVLYFALIGALFDLEESDTRYMVGVFFVVGLILGPIAQAVFHHLF